jgi:plasmid stabilization system protein ParE
VYELSPRAAEDFEAILIESRQTWGELTARRTQQRLEARFENIASGSVLGHRRLDLPEYPDLLFVNEPPFVIVFAADTKRILRIVHGKRGFPRLLRGS